MISQRDSLPDVITGEQENQRLLSSSSQAPDEQTYNMYSSMFDQVGHVGQMCLIRLHVCFNKVTCYMCVF